MPFQPYKPALPHNLTTLTGKLVKPVHGSRWAVRADKAPVNGWTFLLQLDCCQAQLPVRFAIGNQVTQHLELAA